MNKFYAFAAAVVLSIGSMTLAGTVAGPTGQINNQTAAVPIKVVVPSIVSVWADYTEITLTVGQSDGNGFAGAAASLAYINNVDATISVKVDGSLPTGPGAANFFIFKGGTVAEAQAACMASAYAPANALVWTDATMGTSQTFKAVTPTATAGSLPLVYAADIPGGVQIPPTTYDVVVTWTIAENQP